LDSLLNGVHFFFVVVFQSKVYLEVGGNELIVDSPLEQVKILAQLNEQLQRLKLRHVPLVPIELLLNVKFDSLRLYAFE